MSLFASGDTIVLWATPASLESLCVISVLSGLRRRGGGWSLAKNNAGKYTRFKHENGKYRAEKSTSAASKCDRSEWIEQCSRYLENNLSGLASVNTRQEMLNLINSASMEDGEKEELFEIVYIPALATIEIVSEGGGAWARADSPSLDSSMLLGVMRRSVMKGSAMAARKFHFQGYEYQSKYCSSVMHELVSSQLPGKHMFPRECWNKLRDLSLVNYDWLWNNLCSMTMEEIKVYYQSMTQFHQALGQNLPSLSKLEITHPYTFRDNLYFWLFVKDPMAAFPQLPGEEWGKGFIGWNPHKHRYNSMVAQPGRKKKQHQLTLKTVLKSKPELNPICASLSELHLHNATERLPIVAAILSWCRNVTSVDLPEFDLLSANSHAATPEHYRRGFVLPCLSLINKFLYPAPLESEEKKTSNIRQLCVEDPESVITKDLFKYHNLELPDDNVLGHILEIITSNASHLENLYLGNNTRHTFHLRDVLHLQPTDIHLISSLNNLRVLELENVAPDCALEVITQQGHNLQQITLTNIMVDLSKLLSVSSAREITLRNTRVVLNDSERSDTEVSWSKPPPRSSLHLTSLTIEYSVPQSLLLHAMTCLPSLEHLSLGHSRQRYSQASSVVGLTPPTWNHLLHISHLPVLSHLSIPVLYQPGLHPASQVSILDYQDVVMVFHKLPALATALLHRRQFQRNGLQPNFPNVFIIEHQGPKGPHEFNII